jgi:histidinol-phosphate aminotransferase
MNMPLEPLGITQGVAAAALAGPEDLARRSGAQELVRLGSNESPYGPSPRALEAMQHELRSVNRYGDPAVTALRSALATHHAVAAENVAVGAGIDDLIGWAVRAYLAPGAPAIASDGAFPTFEMHVNGFGANLVRVPYRNDGRTDLAGFLHAARRLCGGLIFFPNPDNPSGTHFTWNEVNAFLEALPPNTLVIHDEAYANFLPQNRRFPSEAIDPRMLRMRTFSKEYGLAGLRVGYVLGAPAAIAALDAVRLLYGVSRIAQAAALAALEDQAFIEWVVRETATGRDEYYALGRSLEIATLESTTNFVLFDLGSATRATQAVENLLMRGIHVRKPPVPPLDRYIRVSVGAAEERTLFARALSEIGRDFGATVA